MAWRNGGMAARFVNKDPKTPGPRTGAGRERICLVSMLLAVALLEIAPAAALDVTRFGAVPDDGKDDT